MCTFKDQSSSECQFTHEIAGSWKSTVHTHTYTVQNVCQEKTEVDTISQCPRAHHVVGHAQLVATQRNTYDVRHHWPLFCERVAAEGSELPGHHWELRGGACSGNNTISHVTVKVLYQAVCVDISNIHITQNGSFHCQSYMYTLIWRFFATVYNSQWRDTLQSFGITLPEMICDIQHTHITDNSVYIHVHIHNVLLQTCQNTCMIYTPCAPNVMLVYYISPPTPPQTWHPFNQFFFHMCLVQLQK